MWEAARNRPGQWPYFTFQSISKHPKLDFAPLTNLNSQANPFNIRQSKESDPSSAAYYWKGPDISLHPLESNWRGGERPGAVLVHVLFSASGDFCCCAFSCFSISHKIWKLVLQLWPGRRSQCSVTHQHQTDLVMKGGGILGSQTGMLRLLCSPLSVLGCGGLRPLRLACGHEECDLSLCWPW